MIRKNLHLWCWAAVGLAVLFAVLYMPRVFSVSYDNSLPQDASAGGKEMKFVVTHLATPESVRGVYMTSWVAGTPSLRNHIVLLLDETELNTVVIDIKDDTGRISFEVEDPELRKVGSSDGRIKDLREFIGSLHDKGVYVIGRIAAFQDPHMVKLHPEFAVKRLSDGGIWRDRKGLSWIDPGAKKQWEYLAALAKESYNAGFDEIQFDYIRFPSDGNMVDITYPYSNGQVKNDVIKSFFVYISGQLKPLTILLSVDLFGMTTTNPDDLNIGQVLESAFPYFDYLSPMVYPSHYPSGFKGFADVNAVPYQIVKISLDSALMRLKTYNDTVASTSIQIRPWLQDNDYPVPYTPEMVRAQIQATYDAGLTSWMLWDAGNLYTRAALQSVQ
ncbi:hypothetical protein EPN83_00700 [Patescibacteria group bacterium]|nr:MAG: hypothetical protein EPN83_00700 [Patescibacteria group bacterium]